MHPGLPGIFLAVNLFIFLFSQGGGGEKKIIYLTRLNFLNLTFNRAL